MKPDRTLEIHYYDWRLGAWAMSETRDRLNAAGRGIYRELLDQCYSQGSFPADVDWICRKCACTLPEYEAAWPIISRHFPKARTEGYRKNIIAEMFRKKTFSYLTKQILAKKGKKREPVSAREVIDMQKVGQTKVEPPIMRARATQREVTQRNETERNSSIPPINGTAEYPVILAEIRKHDAAADDAFARRLMMKVTQFCLSSPKYPQELLPELTDENVARCVAESYRTGPREHGTGLLLNRVPNIVLTWSLED